MNNYELRLQTEGDGTIMSGSLQNVVRELKHQIKLRLFEDDEIYEIYNVKNSVVEYELNKKTAIDFVKTYEQGRNK